MKHLKLFNNHVKYEQYLVSKDFVMPSVQACNSEYEAHFHDDEKPFFVPVEYLESTGEQWIDTQIIPNDSTNCDYKFMPTQDVIKGGYSYVFGCWGNTSTMGRYELLNYSDNNGGNIRSEFGFGTGAAKTGGNNVAIGITFQKDVLYSANVTNKSLTVNETKYATLTYSMNQNTLTFYLFTAHDTINNRPSIPQKLYYAKLYNNGTLVRDYIPVRVGDVGYMYDKVSGKLFGNSGSGQFILGPDLYDAEVEYLQSDGTQWIHFDCDPIDKIEIEFKYTSTAIQQRIAAVSNASLNIYLNSLSNIASSINADWKSNNNVYGNKICILTLDARNRTTTVDASGYISSWNHTKAANYARGFYLFRSENTSQNAEGRIYYCKLYRDNVLVFDLIPVRIGNVGFMYDKISKKMFGNLGDNGFTLGKDLVGDIQEIEYIESTGSQIIDTGIFPSTTSGSEITVVASYQGTNSTQCLFGATRSTTYYQINKTTSANQFRLLISNGGDYYFTNPDYSNFHEYRINGRDFYLDNTLVRSDTNNETTLSCTLFLFGRNKNAIDQYGKWRIKSCDINMSSKTVSLVPVRRGKIGYMYEKTSGRLYKNMGSGDFILGPDKQSE